MFSNVRVGDTIYSMVFGPVQVVEVRREKPDYPIKVYCEPFKHFEWITVDGKTLVDAKMPTYFWAKPAFEFPHQPPVELVVDDLIEVRDRPEARYVRRYFHSFTPEGDVFTWPNGTSSATAGGKDSVTRWKEWRYVNTEPKEVWVVLDLEDGTDVCAVVENTDEEELRLFFPEKRYAFSKRRLLRKPC